MSGGVPGGGHADGLGEHGGITGAGDAMQAFVPPIVLRDAEAGNGCGAVHHFRDFFLEGHAADEVGGALLGGKRRVEIRQGPGGLGEGGGETSHSKNGTGQGKNESAHGIFSGSGRAGCVPDGARRWNWFGPRVDGAGEAVKRRK